MRVPLSLVYRKDKKLETNNSVLLYAYGSYGASHDDDRAVIQSDEH